MLYIYKIRCHIVRIRFKKWDLNTGLWNIEVWIMFGSFPSFHR